MYQIGTASNYQDLLDKVHNFVTGTGSAFNVEYTGTGTGKLTNYTGGDASVAETFSVLCTAPGTFSVTGTTSGAIGSATVGAAFSTPQLSFTITGGATAFDVGDKFVLSTAPKWVAKRAVAGSEYIWQAPGNSGGQKILVGASTFANASADYYNWRLGGFIDYDAALPFTGQMNAQTRPCLPLWQNAIPYWLVANGSRLMLVAKVSSVYVSCYLGLLEQYLSPGAHPYPLVVGGSLAFSVEPNATSTSWRWSNTAENARCFAMPVGSNNDSQLRLLRPDGAWGYFQSKTTSGQFQTDRPVWPYSYGMLDLRPNLDGSYPLFPVVLAESVPTNVWGRLDGVAATTGHNSASEALMTVGQHTYMLVQNVFRSTKSDYFAFKLD